MQDPRTPSNPYLRRVGPDDEAGVHQLLCVPEVYRFLADGVEPSPTIAANWIGCAPADADSGGGLWALIDDGRTVGLVRLAADEGDALELIYLLHPSVWGRGYATRMAQAAMAHAFGTGCVTLIRAGADVPNRASVAVMKRLGMAFRRVVDYPAGEGVEYELGVAAFRRDRIRPFSIV